MTQSDTKNNCRKQSAYSATREGQGVFMRTVAY